MGRITAHIDTIVRLANEALRHDAILDQVYDISPLGVDFSDPDVRARFADINAGKDALAAFINDLTTEDLARIHALMYSGRDNVDAEYFKRHFADESREDFVRTILEKRMSLPVYLTKAVARAKAANLDLDSF